MARCALLLRFSLLLLLTLSLFTTCQAACGGEQSYVLSVDIQLTPATLAILPPHSRLPILVAVTHSDSFTLFERGDAVNDAVAEVALRYRARLLEKRLDRIINDDDDDSVNSFVVVDDPDVDGITKLEVRVRDGASRLSIMAPMSPSPGWFIGINAHDLCVRDEFAVEEKNITVDNFDAGLAKGSFVSFDPVEVGENLPVGPVADLEGAQFATLSLERGTLGVDWWKIFLGVLVAVAAVIVLVFCLYPRCRRRKRAAQIPLTAQDGVEW